MTSHCPWAKKAYTTVAIAMIKGQITVNFVGEKLFSNASKGFDDADP